MPHSKPVKFRSPIDSQIIQLESFLSQISRDGLKGLSGSYPGDGTTGRQITIGFYPLIIVISKLVDTGRATFPLAGNMAFSLSGNPGVSYIPGDGFVNDAVLTFNNTGVTLGDNAAVNEAGTDFTYFAIG